MPNRYVRESAIESEAVNALAWDTEVFWRRLLNKVDDFGRCTANPMLLRASIFPLQLDRVSVADVERMLQECEACGLIGRYWVGGKSYLLMNKWEKGRAKESKYPSPPGDLTERLQTYVYTRSHPFAHVPDSDSDSDPDPDPDPDSDTESDSVADPKPVPVVEAVAVAVPEKPAAPAPPPAEPTRKRFVPPTREELDVYAAKIGLGSREVDKFAAWYGSNGWKVSGKPMVSWQHALTGWKLRAEERNETLPNAPSVHGRPARPHRNDSIAGAAEAAANRLERLKNQDPDYVPFA